MHRKELVLTALHVLVARVEGCEPAPADLTTLQKAFPDSAHLPDDDLASHVIRTLTGTAHRETDRVSSWERHEDEVA